jgi:IS30 family transposase
MPRTVDLILEERKAIEKGIKEGLSSLAISKNINRGKNSVVVEIRRSGGRENYSAIEAQEAATYRRKHKYEKLKEFYKQNPEKANNFYKGLQHRIEALEMQIEILTETIREITHEKNQ